MRYAVAVVELVMPDELLATTPPTVQAASLAGSGPSRRWYGASAAFTRRTTAPGSARTRAPSSNTVTPPKCRRVSTRTASVPACPDRLVPPDRNVSGTPSRCAVASSAATSGTEDGVTTAAGVSR